MWQMYFARVREIFIVMWVAVAMAAPVTQAQASGFSEITDGATGVRVSIPFGITTDTKRGRWGTNWSTPDSRLNIDTLNFRGERTLASVHQTLVALKGRRVTQNSVTTSRFEISGNDQDGSFFVVQAVDQDGEVRGLSIVVSGWARSDLAPAINTVLRSFQAFPNSDSVTTSRSSQPQQLTANTPDPNVARLQRELEALQAKMRAQEEDAQRQSERKRTQEREDAIRKEEREKAEDAAKRLEARLEVEMKKLREETKKAAPREQPFIPPKALAGSPLPPGKRVAFVAGINDYPDLPPQQQLQRALNDARTMKATFESLGFEVVAAPDNMTRRQFGSSWQTFLRRIEPGSTAAFFFAGHGLQHQGVNYLLPSDVPKLQPDAPEALQLEALNFNQLYSDVLARKPKISMLILDACRDNPFGVEHGRSLGERRGLTTVKPVEGSFVLYSANADEQALDRLPDDGPEQMNSVFTRVLAPLLLQPDVPVQDLARRVRVEVSELAGRIQHKQWPSYYDGLTGNVCLVGACKAGR